MLTDRDREILDARNQRPPVTYRVLAQRYGASLWTVKQMYRRARRRERGPLIVGANTRITVR